MKKIKIAIVDSGVERPELFEGAAVENDNKGDYYITDDIYDNNGHGTIVTNMIQTLNAQVDLFVMKIFSDEDEVDCSKLIFALKYLREVVKPQIVHLSLGISFCNNINGLKVECDQLHNDGTIIICAYDNNGSLSYPAMFNNVIGVESHRDINKIDEYYMLENSPINIAAIGCAQRLLGKGMQYYDVVGSSFSAPYITAKVSDLLVTNPQASFDDVILLLKNNASRVYVADKITPISKPKRLGKAITFPFNKELNTLLRYSEHFTFELTGIFDVRYMRNIGKKIHVKNMGEFTIQPIEKIDWNLDFDTVILGHVDVLGKLSKINYIEYFIEKCIEHKKNLYSFDPVDSELKFKMIKCGLECFTPEINRDNIPYSFEGKLRQISKPILCVVGTSSKQGKFSLQMQLRNCLSKKINVGLLATEPTGYLVGADAVFPMGYNSTVKISNGFDYIAAANYAIGEIEDIDPDLIITGTQSQTLPMQLCSIRDSMIYNHYFLLGTNPDAIVLVVNVFDEVDYIDRTIKYLESILVCDVIAIAIFPIQRTFKWGTLGDLTARYDNEQLEDFSNILSRHTHKYVFVLDDEEQVNIVAEKCLQYFAEE